jgi:DNA-binding CsgD family transcriptional regulator
MVRGFPGTGAAPVVRRREQIVPDRDWYGSVEFNEAFGPDGIDGGIISTHPLSGGSLDILTAHPRLGRGLGRREMLLVHLVHREIAPLVGRALAGSWEPNLAGLSPRMRQTLDGLLEGDGEKQVALRLGISRETVHVYVKGLYQYFGVDSRSELLAYFLRRYRAVDRTGGVVVGPAAENSARPSVATQVIRRK